MAKPQSKITAMETKLNRIAKIASEDGKAKLNNLVHMLNAPNLKECFFQLRKKSAAGVDNTSWDEYRENLDENLSKLVDSMKRQAYKPKAVKRVYIPKANGRERPLGIPAIEDKIVQMMIRKILDAIYEQDFMDFSYGFRPGRSCHMAIDRLDKLIMKSPINYVIDADIKGFFDNVDHVWMRKFLEERIGDFNLIRIIVRFLKAGVIEDGKELKTEKGTPQGGLISPVLSNIYLHYVLDLWIEKVIKRKYDGLVEIARYADDFVICIRHKNEAEQLLIELKERFKKFGLELSEEKTRLIEFGRSAEDNANKRGGGKSGTFDFLGFTHFCGRSRKGRFIVGRRTARKKFGMKINEMNVWLKKIRNLIKIKDWWKILKAKLRGHFQYYGVSGNFRGIGRFYSLTIRLVHKWINRRSQKKSMNWKQFINYINKHNLPKPKIYHNLYTLYG